MNERAGITKSRRNAGGRRKTRGGNKEKRTVPHSACAGRHPAQCLASAFEYSFIQVVHRWSGFALSVRLCALVL